MLVLQRICYISFSSKPVKKFENSALSMPYQLHYTCHKNISSLRPYFLLSISIFVFPFTCTSDLAQQFAQGLNPAVLLHFPIFLHALRSLTLSHFRGNSSCFHLRSSVHFTTRETGLSVPTPSPTNTLSYATPSSKPR